MELNAEQVTIAGVLIAALITGARGDWVFGHVYKAATKDRDWWRDRALAGTALAEISVEEAEKVKA